MTVPHGFVVGEAHLLEFVSAVELVVSVMCRLTQILHVRPNQHLAQLHEVAVILILNCKHREEYNVKLAFQGTGLGNVHYVHLRNANKVEPTLALNPRGDVTRNPKHGHFNSDVINMQTFNSDPINF